MLNKQDQALIERERLIPGLRYLLQPADLRKLILSKVDIKDPGELKPGYLRYKPGMNCIARFEFSADGEQYFAYAKAFGRNAGTKLEKAQEQAQCASPIGPGRIILQTEQIMFCVFPNDSKLRSLGRLGDDEARQNLFSRLFKSRRGWENPVITPLNYKPERRYVAKITGSNGNAAVLKFYADVEFDQLRMFRKRLQDPPGVKIPEWIGGSKSHNAVALAWIDGSSLSTSIDSPSLDALHETGRAIAHFHASSQPGLRRRRRHPEAKSLMNLAEQLGFLLPDIEREARILARKLAP